MGDVIEVAIVWVRVSRGSEGVSQGLQ